ncbi:alcohol dehydrogenase transcription factor myb/SANT-like domain-containing protein [Phthorimaea operculella]|nr:alcohol dehydrogenase transcription factor myb/SANT-like domain-containing protein [Phthorimaea operculella]
MNARKLIECVRAHECLYDQSVREYRKKHARATAWKKVAEEMNSTASECKKHWMNLRNAYLHAVSRRRRPGNSISKWRYADEMSFLLPFFIPKHSHQPGPANISLKPNEDMILSPNSANSEMSDDERASSTEDEAPPQKKEDISEAVLMYRVLKHFEKPEMNDVESLFMSLAKSVSTFPKMEQILMKRKVFELVNGREIELLEMKEDQQRMENSSGENHAVIEEFSATKSEVQYL